MLTNFDLNLTKSKTKNFFDNLLGVDTYDFEAIWGKTTPFQYIKGESVYPVHDLSDKVLINLEGLARIFYVLPNKEDNTLWISIPSSFLHDVYKAFQHNEGVHFQALTSGYGVSLTVADLEAALGDAGLVSKYHSNSREFTNAQMASRIELLLIRNATERYQQYCDQYDAELRKKIPLQNVASYLGIQPETLSRIRKQLGKSGPEK